MRLPTFRRELAVIHQRIATAQSQKDAQRRKEVRLHQAKPSPSMLAVGHCSPLATSGHPRTTPTPQQPVRGTLQVCAYAGRVAHALRRARAQDRRDTILTQWRLSMSAPDWRAQRPGPAPCARLVCASNALAGLPHTSHISTSRSELEDFLWRPTFLPELRTAALDAAALLADPRRRLYRDLVARCARGGLVVFSRALEGCAPTLIAVMRKRILMWWT